MPAVLVEIAFISNAEEEKKLKSPEFQQAVADAVARAVARFFSKRMPGRRAARRRPAPGAASAMSRRAAAILLAVLAAAVAALLFVNRERSAATSRGAGRGRSCA